MNVMRHGETQRKPIRVLHLISKYAKISGPEQLVLSLATKCNAQKYKSHVALIDLGQYKEKSLIEREFTSSSHLQFIPWSKHRLWTDGISTLKQLILEKEIQIIHSHDIPSNLLTILATLNNKIIRISSRHGYLRKPFRFRLISLLDDMLVLFFNRIIVGSEWVIRNNLRHVPTNRLAVIPNAITLSPDQQHCDVAELRESLHVTPSDLILTTIGRLSSEKGHEVLLDVMPTVLKQFPFTHLFIVGEGPLRPRLEHLVQERGLTNNVHITGHMPEIQGILELSDVYIQPSIFESLPLTVLEAMAHAKPVVCTDVGGIHEAVNNGLNGLLVPARNPSALASAIVHLLENPAVRSSMGEAAKATIEKKFSEEEYIEKHQHMYEEVFQKLSQKRRDYSDRHPNKMNS